jgi:hypothetical protein
VTEVRLLFVFDPDRQAVILVGGDKAGNWSGWYRVAVPRLLTSGVVLRPGPQGMERHLVGKGLRCA